jgi:hypothetical protein
MTLRPASRQGVAWLRVSDRRGLGVSAVTAVTAALAVGVPALAARLVAQRTDAFAAQLGAAAGVEVRIGSIDADLTGTLRLSGVALGTLFAAERIEASVALESLLSGQLAADEIRVASPRIAVEVDRDGDSDLARIVRRLAEHRRPGATRKPTAARVRRIVVSSGTMTARIAGLGEIAADDVELVPDAGGIRVITGKLRVRGASGAVHGELVLARSAAELALPGVSFGRLLAVAGTGSVTIGDRTVVLREVALGRLATGGVLEARGFFDDHGVPRAIGADLVPPRDGSGFALAMHGDRVPLAPFAALAPHNVRLDGARASGRLIVRRHERMVQLDLDGSVNGLHIEHETLAPQPVPIDATLAGMLAVTPDAIAVQQVAVAVGAARWTANGWLRRRAPVTGQLDIQLQPAPCNDLLASLPGELRGVLDGLTMSGTFGGRARLALDLAAPPGEGVELATIFANDCVVVAEPPAADVTSLTTTREHHFPDGTRALVGEDQASHFPLRRLPRFVVGAFVSAEDARFFDHHGFDVTQIARSFEIDLRDRRLARGGSTISQQLVKNAFLTQRRSLDRKIQEAILTWRLEARVDKKAILDRYLNIIELGPRVFGIRAAAEHWFGLSPRELTIRHAAFLAAMTSEPTTMSRRIRNFGGLDPDSAARVDTILRAMTRNGVITKEERDAAREVPLYFSASALRRES